MKKYLSLFFVLCVFSLVAVSSYAHENERKCDCKPCPMCKIFNDEGLLEKSEEELVKVKEVIQEHLSKENMVKLGNKTVEVLQDALAKVDNHLNNEAD